jgi:hypothetical protein
MVNSEDTQLDSNRVNGSSDLEAEIARFLSDSNRQSLVLPTSLTPEQRKEARSMVSQHPELSCESYGFASDRRLHLFKKSATTCIRVKNTFVDGLATVDDENEAIVFRSMPAGPLICAAAHGFNGKVDLSPLSPKAGPLPEPEPVEEPLQAPLPVGPVNLPGASASQNMFCAKIELPPLAPSEATETPSSGQDSSRPSSRQQGPLSSGTMVVIEGLVRSPTFNGRVGVVQFLDEATGRYDVLLASPSSKNQRAKIKHENLRSTLGFLGCETSSAAA